MKSLEKYYCIEDDILTTIDVKNILNKEILNKKETIVLKSYFGIGHYRNYSTNEIGKRYCLSTDRVNKILKRALEKLRKYINDTDKYKMFVSMYVIGNGKVLK